MTTIQSIKNRKEGNSPSTGSEGSRNARKETTTRMIKLVRIHLPKIWMSKGILSHNQPANNTLNCIWLINSIPAQKNKINAKLAGWISPAWDRNRIH
jgi:hypothetical protein